MINSNHGHQADCECDDCIGIEVREPEHDCWEHADEIGLGLLECNLCHALFERHE